MKINSIENSPNLPIHLDFLSKGLACHALCLLKYAGLLDRMVNQEAISEKTFQEYKNPSLTLAAFSTLSMAGVVFLDNGKYQLTSFGTELVKNIDTIFLPIVGYRNLLANQYKLIDDPSAWKISDIDFDAVAEASVDFGVDHLDPLILEVFYAIKQEGTLCDLGCGTAKKLIHICNELGVYGLGIEKDLSVVRTNQKFIQECPFVKVINADINHLEGVWEDVTTAMMNMVFHDISLDSASVQFLKSLQRHFPKLKHLVIIDMVSISEECPLGLPGFDYVHGLQGMTPRNYKKTLESFRKAGYEVVKETATKIPNTFIWVLKAPI